MRNILSAARSGDWLTAARMRAYCLILLAVAGLSIALAVASTRDRMIFDGNQLGTDFSQVWVAGREAREGRPEDVFVIARHVAAQRAEFGPNAAVYGWHYPPYFLGPAVLLARLPYLDALFLWQGLTLFAYLAAIAALARAQRLPLGWTLAAALAFPAVFVNLEHGQNGFLTAALLGGGFLLLDRRPALAGMLFASLAYKPQFALVLPLALILDRRWRTLVFAAATLTVMTLASVSVFGLSSWRAFFDNLAFTRRIVVEQGAAGFDKIQSVFAAVRLVSGGVEAAYAAQLFVSALVLLALVALWRSSADAREKAAATIVSAFLTMPYALDYDMMALAPALVFLAACGRDREFVPYEKSILALGFVAPLFARPIAATIGAPFGVFVILALFVTILRGAIKARGAGLASPRALNAFGRSAFPRFGL